jgi:hypothetical protein
LPETVFPAGPSSERFNAVILAKARIFLIIFLFFPFPSVSLRDRRKSFRDFAFLFFSLFLLGRHRMKCFQSVILIFNKLKIIQGYESFEGHRKPIHA